MRKDPGKRAEVEKGFVSRWSRRKVATDTAQQREDGVAGEAQPGGALSGPGDDAEAPREKILTDEQMPPIDSLTEDSDFSGFLSPGVSEELRQVALRKLFRSAVFNIRDGLDDYDDDFRNFPPLGDLITSDMKHQMELAEARKREAEAAEAADSEPEPEPEPAQDETADETTDTDATAPPDDEPTDTPS